MRIMAAVLTVGIVAGGYTMPARAIGCISGGLAGAVAGHMVHHGILGAVGGCVAGHAYNKHQQTRATQQQNVDPTSTPGGYSPQNGYPSGGTSGSPRSNY